MAPTKRKPGRPPTDRGRGAPQIQFRVSDRELAWATAEAGRVPTTIAKLARNRFFRAMPGYKPEV